MIWKYYFLWSLAFFLRPASCSLTTNQPRASAASARVGPTHHTACGQGESQTMRQWGLFFVPASNQKKWGSMTSIWNCWYLHLTIILCTCRPTHIHILPKLPDSPNSPCLNISCIISRIAKILCPGNQEWCNVTWLNIGTQGILCGAQILAVLSSEPLMRINMSSSLTWFTHMRRNCHKITQAKWFHMLSTAISFPYLPYCCIPFLFPSWLNMTPGTGAFHDVGNQDLGFAVCEWHIEALEIFKCHKGRRMNLLRNSWVFPKIVAPPNHPF